MQALPITSSSVAADRPGDTSPTGQPQASWKRWAVCVISTSVAVVSAAIALSAIVAELPAIAFVYGVITAVSIDCALNALPPTGLPRSINIPELFSFNHDSTADIVDSQGYEIVDVPGNGDCFFHAALVPYGQCLDWNARTLRQQVYEEARQWLQEYENNHLHFNGHESSRDPVPEEVLYVYLTGHSRPGGMTGMETIKCDGEWMDTIIVPLVARVLNKPVITVNDSGTIMNVIDARGLYFPIVDSKLKNLDLKALGDFVLLEHINGNHFRGCRKRDFSYSHRPGQEIDKYLHLRPCLSK